MPRVKPPNPIERRMSRFLREPPVCADCCQCHRHGNCVVVVVSGVLMRVLDHEEYSNVWVGMWWAMQTVTTVGYGDVTPKNPSGRIIAAFVMLEGIAVLTIVIAAITSTFVARAAQEQEIAKETEEDDAEARIESRLDSIDQRLERLENMRG